MCIYKSIGICTCLYEMVFMLQYCNGGDFGQFLHGEYLCGSVKLFCYYTHYSDSPNNCNFAITFKN